MSSRPRGEITRAWVAVAAWTFLVWGMSSNIFSAAETGHILGTVLHWFFPHMRHETFVWIHFLVRKSGHVSEYAALGWLTIRAVQRTPRLRTRVPVLVALLIVATVASLDETRQMFEPDRTPSPRDVGIDTTAGLLGIGVGSWLRRRRGGAPAARAAGQGLEAGNSQAEP